MAGMMGKKFSIEKKCPSQKKGEVSLHLGSGMCTSQMIMSFQKQNGNNLHLALMVPEDEPALGLGQYKKPFPRPKHLSFRYSSQIILNLSIKQAHNWIMIDPDRAALFNGYFLY